MLVLKRFVNERVILRKKHSAELIGTITVVESGMKGFRLGFDFPDEVEIIREELLPAWQGHKEGTDGKSEGEGGSG